MIRDKRLAAVILAFAFSAAPALAQAPRPGETIQIVQGGASAPVSELGPVTAEYHQKSMFSKIDAREELNKQLRAAAARLGADAVINVSYDMNSPMTSKKGQLAKGVAVKYLAPAAQPVQIAAAPAAVAPAPPVAPPVTVAPVTPPVVIPPVPAAAPAAPATAATMIALAEGDVPGGRAYSVVGAIVVDAKPQLDKAPRQVLDEALRAKAKALGADAVIQIRYDATGASAQGVAVKYK